MGDAAVYSLARVQGRRRMAVIADPAGAALSLWQPGRSIGAEIVNVRAR